MSVVELGPVVKTINVGRTAADAFRIFTNEIAAWWPMATHTRARDADGEKTVNVTIEPRVGGRVFETLQDGRELEWGEVTKFEPGALLALNWRLGRPPAQYTDLSVRFEALDDKSCQVTLTHENWERMGAEGKQLHDGYANGWATVFEKSFKNYADKV